MKNALLAAAAKKMKWKKNNDNDHDNDNDNDHEQDSSHDSEYGSEYESDEHLSSDDEDEVSQDVVGQWYNNYIALKYLGP